MITYDSTGTKSAFLTLSTSVAEVRPYLRAMQTLPLGPQTFYGNNTWDPLGKLPDVEAALNTVKNHCFVAQIYFLDLLMGFVGLLTKAVGTTASPGPVSSDFSAVLNVVNELSSTGALPTPQQRQTVATALNDLQNQLTNMLGVLNNSSQAGKTFIGQLPGDVQTLTTGVAAIGPVIASMNQNYENAVMEYSGLGGSGIVKALEAILAPQVEGLEAVQSAIAAAISAEQSVGSAISQLLSVFVTLNTDYQLAIQSVINASDDTFASGLLAFDVPSAQTYWQQACQDAQSSGL